MRQLILYVSLLIIVSLGSIVLWTGLQSDERADTSRSRGVSSGGADITNETYVYQLNVNDEYTLPTSDGTTGQVFVTDGAGHINFSTITTGATTEAALESQLTDVVDVYTDNDGSLGMAIGDPVTSGTSGSVLFINATSALLNQDNTSFFWDDGNNRLGLGTDTPGYTLSVLGDGIWFDGGSAKPMWITNSNYDLILNNGQPNTLRILPWNQNISLTNNGTGTFTFSNSTQDYLTLGISWSALTDDSPVLRLWNTSEEDISGGRESALVFYGEQSGGELSALITMAGAHSGSGDDTKGRLTIQPSEDATDCVQLLDTDGGIPILSGDCVNERIGIGSAAPTSPLHVYTATGTSSEFLTTIENVDGTPGESYGLKIRGGGGSTSGIILGAYDYNDNHVFSVNGTGQTSFGPSNATTNLDANTSSTGAFPLSIRGDIDAAGQYVGLNFGLTGVSGYKKAAIIAEGTNGSIDPNLHFALLTGGGSGSAGLSDAKMTLLNGGNLGVGVIDPDANIESLNTGTQLKLSYDGTDNTTFAVDTNGDMTVTPSGDEVTVAGAVATKKYTADPCGSIAEGMLWYNDTSDYYCFCNGAGADLKVSDNSACF